MQAECDWLQSYGLFFCGNNWWFCLDWLMRDCLCSPAVGSLSLKDKSNSHAAVAWNRALVGGECGQSSEFVRYNKRKKIWQKHKSALLNLAVTVCIFMYIQIKLTWCLQCLFRGRSLNNNCEVSDSFTDSGTNSLWDELMMEQHQKSPGTNTISHKTEVRESVFYLGVLTAGRDTDC